MKKLIRKILKESQPDWVEDYKPFWYKENTQRLGGSLDWGEMDEWDKDKKIKKWEKENRIHATPLTDFTYGVYVIKGDDEVIDYMIEKFKMD